MAIIPLKRMTNYEAMNRETLMYRELELDRQLLNRPEVVAQRVQRELIKQLQITAPYLIPMVIK